MRSLIPFRIFGPKRQKLGGLYREEPPLTRPPLAHDPAPSLWAYRMQRIMLTPYLRALLRVGLPSLALLLAASLYISNDERRAELLAVFADLREQFESRPEFMVSLVSIEGSTPELAEAVRARLDLNLPQSSFDLDLGAAHARVMALDAVKSADLRLRSGGILEVVITEREPALVWRHDQGLMLIDENGHRVAGLFARADRSDLPLVAGAGADLLAPEALEIFAAAGPILSRIRGLVRVGERRWDVMLDRDQVIKLPSDAPRRALERLLALDQAQNLLDRDLAVIDLRIAARTTLRLTPEAVNAQRVAAGLEPVELAQ